MNNPTRQIKAIALVLTKSKLFYNADGLAQVKLQLMLGDKAMLLDDQHPFAKKEILQAIARDHIAWQASTLSSAQQVTFCATFITGTHEPRLELTTISPVNTTDKATFFSPR